jgi:hypothetical protein
MTLDERATDRDGVSMRANGADKIISTTSHSASCSALLRAESSPARHDIEQLGAGEPLLCWRWRKELIAIGVVTAWLIGGEPVGRVGVDEA